MTESVRSLMCAFGGPRLEVAGLSLSSLSYHLGFLNLFAMSDTRGTGCEFPYLMSAKGLLWVGRVLNALAVG